MRSIYVAKAEICLSRVMQNLSEDTILYDVNSESSEKRTFSSKVILSFEYFYNEWCQMFY